MPTIKLLKRQRDSVPTKRKGEYQNIYQDKRWKKLRDLKAKNEPTCEECWKKGKVKPMDEVHHIIPFQQGKTPEEIESLAFDWDNLISLCEPCHEKAHKRIKNKYNL